MRALAATAFVLLLFTGCSSSQKAPPPSKMSGFLSDYTKLRAGDSEEFGFVYSGGIEMGQYTRVYLEPVTVWRGREAKERGAPRERAQLAADYLYTLVYQRLAQDYEMVKMGGPNTMIVRVAFTNAEGPDGTMDIVSTDNPQPNLVQQFNAIQEGVVPTVGQGVLEAEARDSETGTVLWAGVEREAGADASTEYTWGDLRNDLQYDADRIRYLLCRERGDDCPRPRAPKVSKSPTAGS